MRSREKIVARKGNVLVSLKLLIDMLRVIYYYKQ